LKKNGFIWAHGGIKGNLWFEKIGHVLKAAQHKISFEISAASIWPSRLTLFLLRVLFGQIISFFVVQEEFKSVFDSRHDSVRGYDGRSDFHGVPAKQMRRIITTPCMDTIPFYMSRKDGNGFLIIGRDDYIPNFEDYIHLRMPTTGVNRADVRFVDENNGRSHNILFTDVGGQRNERLVRRCWLFCVWNCACVVLIEKNGFMFLMAWLPFVGSLVCQNTIKCCMKTRPRIDLMRVFECSPRHADWKCSLQRILWCFWTKAVRWLFGCRHYVGVLCFLLSNQIYLKPNYREPHFLLERTSKFLIDETKIISSTSWKISTVKNSKNTLESGAIDTLRFMWRKQLVCVCVEVRKHVQHLPRDRHKNCWIRHSPGVCLVGDEGIC